MCCLLLTRDVCFVLVSESVHMHPLCLTYNLYFLEETWWNPESLNQDGQGYLHLLLGLFDLLVCGASEGINAVQYRALMNLLLRVLLLHLLPELLFINYYCSYKILRKTEENGELIMQRCLWHARCGQMKV